MFYFFGCLAGNKWSKERELRIVELSYQAVFTSFKRGTFCNKLIAQYVPLAKPQSNGFCIGYGGQFQLATTARREPQNAVEFTVDLIDFKWHLI